MVESNDGNYIFTGRRDMKVTVWFKNWIRLCEFSSPVSLDRLFLSKSNETLFAIPYAKTGHVNCWRVQHELKDLGEEFAIQG